MELFVGIAVFVGLLAAIYRFGRWILGPIDRAARNRLAPARVSIGDILCLFIAVQLPLTFVSRLHSEETELHYWICTVLAWIVAPIIWIACAISLSRAGITNGKHRLAFMGVVLPLVYYGLTPFVLMTCIAIVLLLFGQGFELFDYVWTFVAWFVIGIALIGCGIYTNWLVANVGPDDPMCVDDADPMSDGQHSQI